jgi:ribosomal protein L11 methyltransferase
MTWVAVEMRIHAESVEALSDALIEQGAFSVDVSDANAGTRMETPVFGEPGEDAIVGFGANRMVALFDAQTDLHAVLLRACAGAGLAAIPFYSLSEVGEQDWVRLTQSQFTPIRVSQRMWIVPTWHDLPEDATISIVMDPGLAFGTGSHPTTRLCLEWLDENLTAGTNMIDYGCGSGILAIAAAKLGAARAVGVDIDPQAVLSSRYNAVQNCVNAVFESAAEAHLQPADVVIANILSNPLKVLAPVLAQLTRPGGTIVLCGILAPQAGEVAAVYATWFEMQSTQEREGWARLCGVRRFIANSG